MNAIDLQLDEGNQNLLISQPKLSDQPFRFLAPEFNGKTGEGAFAIDQVLSWQMAGDGRAKFNLKGSPESIGIDFKGSVKVGDDELLIRAQVRNMTPHPILAGHHSLVLDTDAAPDFHDPTGERTFFYAETGWASLAQLVDPLHSGTHSIRMGAAYNAVTVMWKMAARMDAKKKVIAALALDKGYAFAGDHPEWPKGILGGYRWGTIGAGETKDLKGKIYFLKGGLNDLRLKYINDFK